LLAQERNLAEKKEELYPTAKSQCYDFDFSPGGIPALLPELMS
jgi:hypothetical protein